MEQKENRKTRYTKMVLRESLVELMKTRSILHISIKDICDIADISRSTFYAHYKDQYDLLRQIEDETFAYFENLLDKYKDKRGKKEMIQMFDEIFTYIANNGDSIQVLFSENGDIDYQKKILHRFIDQNQIMKLISEKQQDVEINNYFSVFVVHGVIGLVQYWLKNNMSIPVPQLANILFKWTEQWVKL